MQVSQTLDTRNLARISSRLALVSTRLRADVPAVEKPSRFSPLLAPAAIYFAAIAAGDQDLVDMVLLLCGGGFITAILFILSRSETISMTALVAECTANPWTRVSVAGCMSALSALSAFCLGAACVDHALTAEIGALEALLLAGTVWLGSQAWDWLGVAAGRESSMRRWMAHLV